MQVNVHSGAFSQAALQFEKDYVMACYIHNTLQASAEAIQQFMELFPPFYTHSLLSARKQHVQ